MGMIRLYQMKGIMNRLKKFILAILFIPVCIILGLCLCIVGIITPIIVLFNPEFISCMKQ